MVLLLVHSVPMKKGDLDQVIESIRNPDSDNANEDGDDNDVDDEGDGINRPETGGASGVDTAPSVSNEYLRLPINPTSAEREQHENLLKEFHKKNFITPVHVVVLIQ